MSKKLMEVIDPDSRTIEIHEVNPSVDHPSHYNMGKIEAIEIIEDWNLNFNLGNVIKYTLRAPYKGKMLEDLKKVRWYINREIERISAGGNPTPHEPTKD